MAGTTVVSEMTPRRAWMRVLAVAMLIAVASIAAGVAAYAQVPGVPGVPSAPPIPPQVQGAIDQAQHTVVPVLVDAAIAAQPAANAGGFALRPPCGAYGTAILLVAIAGGGLPVSPGVVSTPIFIMCGASYDTGPADAAFADVDAQAGPQVSEGWGMVQPQAYDALTPVRPNLSEACTVIGLMGSTPRQVPPPLNRINVVKVACG
jgi:hypothetical protein